MLYTVANDDWTPGLPLLASKSRSGLYRTRSQAAAIAGGRCLLAVSVRYDDLRGVLTTSLPAHGKSSGSWSSPAVVDCTDGVTCLAEIPAHLVRALGPRQLRIHAGHSEQACPRMILQAGPFRSNSRG